MDFLPGFGFNEPIYGEDYYGGDYYGDDYYGDGYYGDDYYGGGGYYEDDAYGLGPYGPEIVYPDEYDTYGYGGPVIPAPPIPMPIVPPPPKIVEVEVEEQYAVPAIFDAKKAERVACKKNPCKKNYNPAYEPEPVNVKEWLGEKWEEPQPFLYKKKPNPVLASPEQLFCKETKVKVDPRKKSWKDVVHEQTNVSRITEWLYVCGASAVTPNNLKTYSITQIINVTATIEPVDLPSIKTTWVKVDDNPKANICKFFDIISQQIADTRKSGGHVLIHAVNGVSRAPTMCIAYLMKCHRMSLADAMAYVRDRRPGINPNPGFINQLEQYAARLFGGNITTMVGGPSHWK